jgi:hypothetical protein
MTQPALALNVGTACDCFGGSPVLVFLEHLKEGTLRLTLIAVLRPKCRLYFLRAVRSRRRMPLSTAILGRFSNSRFFLSSPTDPPGPDTRRGADPRPASLLLSLALLRADCCLKLTAKRGGSTLVSRSFRDRQMCRKGAGGLLESLVTLSPPFPPSLSATALARNCPQRWRVSAPRGPHLTWREVESGCRFTVLAMALSC